MYATQDQKIVNIGPPAAALNSTSLALLSPGYLDTRGFHSVRYYISIGADGAAATALNVTECDTTAGTYTVIPGSDFSVAPLVLPPTSDANTDIGILIPINGVRKRYQKLVLTAGAVATYATAVAILGNPDNAPFDLTSRGLVQEAVVVG